ncbi:alpha/beta fold hydrolase [Geodermatophilus sp. URMC 61]|uniref:alpha/beta fold hydrolase n=1 Tax=Geodermatophilus sp. URMC 61 TaxID=3423411 RepID=UPI00406D3BAF
MPRGAAHRRLLDGLNAAAAGQTPPEVSIPTGFTTFPGEIWRTSRTWAEKAYPNLTYCNEVDRGGHFAAWEEPELFATEVRAAFGPLRAAQIPEPRR